MGRQRASSPTRAYRTAAYLRVSTDEQADSGLGLEAQRARCLAMATVKNWNEPAVYCDAGISGTKDATKRPELQRLLSDVRAGNVDAVIILSLDRLGRKTRLVLDLVEELARHRVALVSCKESLDTTSPQGQFVLTMFAALAQLERDLVSERTKAALTERSKQNGDAGGRMPYGYVRVESGVVVDVEAIPTIKFIFNARKRGDSLRDIAAKLNERSIVGPRGGVWHHTSVKEVLANRDAYMGRPRGLSDVRWPAVLKAS
jgi:site-specific DNA recombinase